MILLLLLVGLVYGFLGELRDAVTIFVIIIAVLAIEMANESRAKGAIKALSRFTAIRTPVIRDGAYQEIRPSELVPGDVVILRPGERIPADLRLLESSSLRVDESSLTGESVPVQKDAEAVFPEKTDLGDRLNLAFSGTLVTSGKGIGVVVATGMSAELGKIAGLVKEAREPRTPLQLHMKELSKSLVWIALGASALVAIALRIQGAGWRETVLAGLTLAFATIPEELPILIAMVLGLGAYRLSKQQAIVRRLRTAEILGSVTVIATDKTGTLTENQMVVDKWFVNGQEYAQANWQKNSNTDIAVQIGCLANDGLIMNAGEQASFEGDPTDTAFLYAAEKLGYDVAQLKSEYHVMEQYPFDDANQRVSVVVSHHGNRFLLSKGAPEQLLDSCSRIVWFDRLVPMNADLHERTLEHAFALAQQGYRVIGLAYRNTEPAEEGLIFVGLAALYDPPRQDVAAAVNTLRQAGVRILMVTGDHAETARSIAEKVNLDVSGVLLGREIEGMTDDELAQKVRTVSVCARTTPEHKLRIVRALQEQGEVVAVTGDGVNDGPALKEAAVGIAMGKSGTDAAKESADMVLGNDHFATVALAVSEGRKLFANLYKAVRYYLAAKVALVTCTFITVAAGLSLPFAPVQIIMMELFMDLGAATSFTAERQESDGMKRKPRRSDRRFMDRAMIRGIFSGGFSLAIAVLAAYLWALRRQSGTVHAQSVAFAAWIVGHLILALLMRSEREPLLKLGLFTNRAMLLWFAAAIGFLVIAMYVPYLRDLLHLTTLTFIDWVTVVLCSFAVPLWIEVGKWLRWKA
nr:cation-transporting P-type ATPase [Paenibacillus sp. VKM B-2647]